MILHIIISIIEAVIVWFVIAYLGTNLVGMIGRGFLEKPLDTHDYANFLKNEVKKENRAGHFITGISILATLAVCFFVYLWWGILFLIPIILIMISRIPDLYWEVRVLPKELGVSYPVPKDQIRQAIKSKSRNMPAWDFLLTSLTWVALVVLFIAFFLK